MRFTTTLGTETGKELFIELPTDPTAELGKKRAPVRVTLNGHSYRSTVSVYGGRYYLPVRREIRDAAGVAAGQSVKVVVELDTDERTVTPPTEIAAVLRKSKAARTRWEAMSYTARKELAEGIEAAKRPETRARRVAAATAQLRGE